MMLLEWMIQATVLSGLVGVGAVLLERVVGGGRRWLWLAALLSGVVVPLCALLVPAWWPAWLLWRAAVPVAVIPAPVPPGGADMLSSGAAGGLTAVQAAWAAATLVSLAVYACAWVRLASLTRGCTSARIDGHEVQLTERLGPAVIGLWRARVVTPRWILSLPRERQRVILLHEVEHMRAGDHWLLGLAPLLAVLFPWNVPLWWQLRRLRLAVELDCDARVLSRGVPALEYGTLLLDVAGSPATFGAPALAESRALLQRRLEVMASPWRHPGSARRLARAVPALAVVALGCLAAAPARVATAPASGSPDPGAPVHVLNGVVLAAASAIDVEPGRTTVLDVDVVKDPALTSGWGAAPGQGVVLITTRDSAIARTGDTPPQRNPMLPADGGIVDVAAIVPDDAAGPAPSLPLPIPPPPGTRVDDVGSSGSAPPAAVAGASHPPLVQPLFIVDGVITAVPGFAALELEPAAIERIEVIKGAAAWARYGARARGGVIMITTVRGAGDS